MQVAVAIPEALLWVRAGFQEVFARNFQDCNVDRKEAWNAYMEIPGAGDTHVELPGRGTPTWNPWGWGRPRGTPGRQVGTPTQYLWG